MEDENVSKTKAVFEGEARIGEVMGGFQAIRLSPEDMSSPLSFQMALTRIYESLMKSLEEGPKKKYFAEVRFKDDMGNPVVISIDLGDKPPLFSSDKVKARVLVEIYEEE
ncbi:MAG: hypothetical protein GSR82_01855 [Desulfurococcales archaeon]|nr:hypothetical protein [Desulfurococcales archaeon]MEB3758460.1 hypothetical protein [Desulfurococcales archaeon]MEB3772407.1 hypothetical protein [Desulfurococcales archaeon]MEB3798966.1 hypothetical protein [Desulfurococcales archaeon]MEB3845746.1 hypothetical protein [Desulfurococcales archaeon]